MSRFEVQVEDSNGRLIPLSLAVDDKGLPRYQAHLVRALQPSVILGEAGYGAMIPDRSGVYSQADVSGGVGVKIQVASDSANATRYYYGEWIDASIAGEIQKGPDVTTLTAPTNSGPLVGMFELDSTPYLVLGRRIVSWASDSLTAVNDFGSGVAGTGAATFISLGSEASVEANTSHDTSFALQTLDTRAAQKFVLDDTGVRFLSKIDLRLTRTGTVSGDVRLSIQADLNGVPSNQTITSSRISAGAIATSEAGYTFRFDDDDTMGLVFNIPYWLVLDVAGADSANYISISQNTTSAYAAGAGYTSLDAGNLWTALSSGADFYFNVYAKTATTTAFVGVGGQQVHVNTTDGATYNNDSWRESPYFAVVGDLLVRAVGHGSSTSAMGALEWSSDGVNWNTDVAIVGDPSIPVTNLIPLGSALIVCKENGIWAADFSDTNDVVVTNIYGTGRLSTNGKGACFWHEAVFVPIDGRLSAIQGDFTSGFDFFPSVGPESLPGWDFPHGQGRVTAVAGDRFHLYAAVSATGGYRLYKCRSPLNKNGDSAAPDWHGSLATIGDGTQTIQFLAIWDPGGTSNPQLFATTTSNDIARITLPRTANPAGDSGYSYDHTNVGKLFYPEAHGNFHVNPKAWLYEAMTFVRTEPGEYAEMLYDSLDGEGYRRPTTNPRLYDTGVIEYPPKLSSRLLARQLNIVNTSTTTSPIILATGVTYAVRQPRGQVAWEVTFVVNQEDNLSGVSLGDSLGTAGLSTELLLDQATGDGGTHKLTDPWGRTYSRVLFVDAEPILIDASGRAQIQITALALG